jgi:predicted nuclease of predicted toxin-antitoxin system
VNLVLDVNLSPAWIAVLKGYGWSAKHWSEIGAASAADAEIMAWAKANDYCVVTNDLDLRAILAATRASGLSVVQIRGQDLAPAVLSSTLVSVLQAAREHLRQGAILTVDLRSSRVRMLPLSEGS